ncbi:hypothetical protein BDW59DRAFT_140983 [Aspergillus cavernicola]|uniref:BZIP domain-containing protein n=1 Tax=Aspergillus cavernicola TaxID=176166 RepID=A0ABR4IRQ5_9EURO
MPPRTRDVVHQTEAVMKERRKPVRRDPERRRQQNIQAQRKYREKLRERLDRLEAFAASATQTDKAPPVETEIPEVDTAHASSNAPQHGIPTSLSAYNALDVSATCLPAATLAQCQSLIPQLDVIPSSMGMWNSPTHVTLPANTSELNMWDPVPLLPQPDDMTSALNMWYPPTHVPLPDSTPSTLCMSDSGPFVRSSDSTPSEESIWDSITQGPPSDGTPSAPSISELTTPAYPPVVTHDKSSNDFRPCWTTTVNCGCSSPHFQIQTQGPKPFSFGEFKILRYEASPPAADPYANHLRIDSICTITALYALGMHVGVTEDDICGDESLSPFFRPGTQSADALVKSSLIHSVKAAFKSLKPDMRPSNEQITVPHHPYIDILPFPSLRKYLITHQEELDEDGFFHDMLTGLVCWGGTGLGQRDRNHSTGHASTGTPWDVRSWEARVWFLKKYWNWLGGEDGELVRQSEWWRSIRGDDSLEVEEL